MLKRPQIDYHSQNLDPARKYDIVLAYISNQPSLDNLSARPKELIKEGIKYTVPTGLFFVYGDIDILPYHAIEIEKIDEDAHGYVFKYLIAVRTKPNYQRKGLSKNFKGLLLYGSKQKFSLNKVRIPHLLCSFCGENIRDWGGKKHLMHPKGAALSDVWKDISVSSNEELPNILLERVVELSPVDNPTVLLIRLPCEKPPIPSYATSPQTNLLIEVNNIEEADCIEYMQRLPAGCVDLAFADPPYNLDKAILTTKTVATMRFIWTGVKSGFMNISVY